MAMRQNSTIFSNPQKSSTKNSGAAPISVSRLQAATVSTPQRGVVPEYFGGLISENGAGTYNLDVLQPAGSLIVSMHIHAIALWTAGTSAQLNVGDFTNVASPVAIDDDGFFDNVDLKATDLLAGESLSLLGGGQGGKAGVYNAGSNTHWSNLYTATERIIRFSVVSVGAGTAGRTYCTVGFVHLVEHLRTVTQ